MTDKMQVNLRQVAMEILYEVQKNNGLLHVVLSDALKKYQYLDKNERSFISRLVQGTEERKIELDYIIDSFSNSCKKTERCYKNYSGNVCLPVKIYGQCAGFSSLQ